MDLVHLAAGVLQHPDPAPAPVAYAAGELARYLGRLYGRTPEVRACNGPAGAWLHLDVAGAPPPPAALAPPADAEAAVRPGNAALSLAAGSPRALLAAVYALLEAAGCRWSPWGPDDEHVPAGADVRGVPALVVRPPFARRAWASDVATWHYTMPDRLAGRLPGDVAFVDWLAKAGATGFLFIRHANDTRWDIPALRPELARRGLELEAGGHALVELLPRSLHRTHPEHFPVDAGGTRSDFGNVCASSAGALRVIADGARAVCAELGVEDLHLWPLDLAGGGWCRCADCAPLSASDQSLRVCNAAAAAGDGRVYHLAYHDTIPVPHAVRPHARVFAEFAPRERCYAHPIDDPGCATNARHRDALARHLDLFDGRVDVFEYYADAILFGGCAVPLPEVIARDLACYRHMGVRGVSCLGFGRYSLWAYGANVEAFAAAARGGDVGTALATWAARYGDGPATATYLAALEALMRRVVTYGDVYLPPTDDGAARVRDALAAAAREAATVRRLLARAARGLADGSLPPSARARLAAEHHLLDYTLAAIVAVRGWLGARLGPGDERARASERALAAIGRAVEHIAAVEPQFAGTWGTHDLEVTVAFFTAALRARG